MTFILFLKNSLSQSYSFDLFFFVISFIPSNLSWVKFLAIFSIYFKGLDTKLMYIIIIKIVIKNKISVCILPQEKQTTFYKV